MPTASESSSRRTALSSPRPSQTAPARSSPLEGAPRSNYPITLTVLSNPQLTILHLAPGRPAASASPPTSTSTSLTTELPLSASRLNRALSLLSSPAPLPSCPSPLKGDESKGGLGAGEKPAIKSSKSWLGSWLLKREPSPANGPGPVRANLGEKTSLYYDETAKQWISKGDKAEAPPAIVPPSRAATASPSKALRNNSPRFGNGGGGDNVPPVPSMPPRSQTTGPPPLSRSATSADLRSDSRPPSRGSGGATPVEGAARGGRRPKPKYFVVAP